MNQCRCDEYLLAFKNKRDDFECLNASYEKLRVERETLLVINQRQREALERINLKERIDGRMSDCEMITGQALSEIRKMEGKE